MSEESEGQDTGTEAVAGGVTSVDPAAVALALGGASRSKADDFLDNQNALTADQRALLDIQKHHLREQFKQLRLNIWQQRLGVLLRVATAFVGFAIAAALAVMISNAAHSNDLVIELFSVPPDLAVRGLTGEVVAKKLLDHLVAMQAQTNSQRAAKSYANSWDENGIKLDIPETGVSFTELDHFLRGKLGHDTHVSGEIVRTGSGVSLTVRAGTDGADSVTAPETDSDMLIQRSAESIYRMTQLYRYGVYLSGQHRTAEAVAVHSAVVQTGSAVDRAWAYSAWSMTIRESEGVDASLRLLRKAIALYPDFPLITGNTAFAEREKSLPEQAVRNYAKAYLSASNQESMRPDTIPIFRNWAQAESGLETGAFHDSAQEAAIVARLGLPGRFGASAILARAETGEHDVAAARATLAEPAKDYSYQAGFVALYNIWAQMQIDSEAQDWADTLSEVKAIDPLLLKYPGLRTVVPTMIVPLTAYAEAKLGKIADAEAHIAATPTSCYDCLLARARIAELKSEHAQADTWFARAAGDASSIPFAYEDWGESLLARDNPNDAIVKFTLANQKGPHFADPLEMWGEALMAKNQSHLALAKFAEAEKYAPNWGRLHLKWGEALFYAGKRDEAKAQFARAMTLDLTPAERSELLRRGADHA